jgi:hypothetical protein
MEKIKVITSLPVIDEYNLTAIDPSENYYNGVGDVPPTAVTTATSVAQQSPTTPTQSGGKVVWDKVKKAWVKAKDTGLVDSALAFLNRNKKPNVPVDLTPPPPPVQEKGLSQGAKIGLIIGGVAVVGVVLYFLLRDKSAPAQVTSVRTGV